MLKLKETSEYPGALINITNGQGVLVLKCWEASNEVGLILSPGEGLGSPSSFSRPDINCELCFRPNIAQISCHTVHLKLSQIRWKISHEIVKSWSKCTNAALRGFPSENAHTGFILVRIFKNTPENWLYGSLFDPKLFESCIILISALNHHLCFAVLPRVV